MMSYVLICIDYTIIIIIPQITNIAACTTHIASLSRMPSEMEYVSVGEDEREFQWRQ